MKTIPVVEMATAPSSSSSSSTEDEEEDEDEIGEGKAWSAARRARETSSSASIRPHLLPRVAAPGTGDDFDATFRKTDFDDEEERGQQNARHSENKEEERRREREKKKTGRADVEGTRATRFPRWRPSTGQPLGQSTKMVERRRPSTDAFENDDETITDGGQ